MMSETPPDPEFIRTYRGPGVSRQCDLLQLLVHNRDFDALGNRDE